MTIKAAPLPSVSTEGTTVVVDCQRSRLTFQEAHTFAEELRIHAGKAAALEAEEVTTATDWVAVDDALTRSLRKPNDGSKGDLEALARRGLLRSIVGYGRPWRRTSRGDAVLAFVDQIRAEGAGSK